ncbi:MAG: phage major capsid protein family [Herbinix sp.]|jgi:HK97 family phage major capsid protein|nr:phage major capsid protein family [Herbinix sp.]
MNLKKLYEERNAKVAAMKAILSKMETEERAEMTAEETAAFDKAETEVRALEETITRAERARSLNLNVVTDDKKAELRAEEVAATEERAFENYIKSQCGVAVEIRAGEQNLTMANNGAVIPVTIANRIISTVKEMCPILSKVTMFAVKGTLKVPVWGLANTTHDISVGYQAEFTDITADAGKFTSVDLTGYLAGALTLLGKSVINNSEISVVDFVVSEMSKKIALFIEKELLNGTTDKATGALATTTTLLAGSTTAITADILIELQAKVPTVYQTDACWTMAPATFTAIRKLKDGQGQYLLQPSLSQAFPYTLLGKPVYLSDNMPAIASAAKAVLYGDYSGLAVNMRENIEIQILNEKYATMHAVGIVSWFEFDSKVIDNQKLATLVMSVS